MEKETLHGLSCPNCGGMTPIPEGQVIVICPYCELRSFVRGERGLRRYQVPVRAGSADDVQILGKFLSRHLAVARDAKRQAQVNEAFLVYLPFWTIWGRAAAWAFGQKKVGSGDRSRYEPREVRVVQEMTWNCAACDVGEFGVVEVPLPEGALEPFDSEQLHSAGMVFEPVGAFSQAAGQAQDELENQVRRRAKLDRISQLFVRFFRQRAAVVYFPLRVVRYLYRGRSFQVVLDGYTGEVLYGKAPGNTLYRAAMLVGGMALGALLAVDAPAFLLSQVRGDDNEGLFALALFAFLGGLGLMAAAYRAFRYGEHYEYRKGGLRKPGRTGENPLEALTSGRVGSLKLKDLEGIIDQIT